MTELITLEEYLAGGGTDPRRRDVGQVILALATAAREIADLLAGGSLAGDLAAHRGNSAFGDTQKELDLRADALVLDALRSAPVRVMASEEMDEALVLDPAMSLAVAVDPLDGSSNIDTNTAVGTIFSILPTIEAAARAEEHILQPGINQVAAGFFVYGPQTALVLTIGDGTRLFTLERSSGTFLARREMVAIPPETREYAINGSNWRHWDEPVQSYISALLMGADGPRGHDYNTRWLASMVAEAFRILQRGGIYLYPGDGRPGYEQGRLRLTYEANPIALLIEQAGGEATDGRRRILNLTPRSLHARVPLVFGSRREVSCVRACYEHEHSAGDHPLFGKRKLFRSSTSCLGMPACP